MKNVSMKIKRAVRKWLGLGESFIGVDMGVHDQSCIVVVSRLNDGSVRIVDARFNSQMEIERFIKECQARYGIPDKDVFRDVPYGMKRRSF